MHISYKKGDCMKQMKNLLSIFVCVTLFNMHLVKASSSDSTRPEFITSMQMVNTMDREANENDVKELLSNTEIRSALIDRGHSPEEIEVKLATLSDVELNQLNTQLKQAQAGGILVTILVVLLIIYVAQRL